MSKFLWPSFFFFLDTIELFWPWLAHCYVSAGKSAWEGWAIEHVGKGGQDREGGIEQLRFYSQLSPARHCALRSGGQGWAIMSLWGPFKDTVRPNLDGEESNSFGSPFPNSVPGSWKALLEKCWTIFQLTVGLKLLPLYQMYPAVVPVSHPVAVSCKAAHTLSGAGGRKLRRLAKLWPSCGQVMAKAQIAKMFGSSSQHINNFVCLTQDRKWKWFNWMDDSWKRAGEIF